MGFFDGILNGISTVFDPVNSAKPNYTGFDLSGNKARENAATAAYNRNATEAQKNRDFQEMMSNTAVRRRAADLKAANINPLFAAGSAASQPSGGAASAPMPNQKGAAEVIGSLTGLVSAAARLL